MIFVIVASLTRYNRKRNMTDIRTIGNLSWDVSSEEEAYKECVAAPTVMLLVLDGWSLAGVIVTELKPETLLQDKDAMKFFAKVFNPTILQQEQPEGEAKSEI